MAISFIEGKFGNAIRLNGHSLFLSIGLETTWTICCYRKLSTEIEWVQVIKTSEGNVYDNGNLNSGYNHSWVTVTNGNITISSTAEDIDELLIMNTVVTAEQIDEWVNIYRPFYDVIEESNLIMPTNINMEVL